MKSTQEYKESLHKLLALYEKSEKQAEVRLDQSKKLLADNLLSPRDVERNENVLVEARLKVEGVKQQIAAADKQIADALTEVEAEYKRAIAEEARQRKRAISKGKRPAPPCRFWMIETDRRSNLGGDTVSHKVVCGSHH